MIVNVGLRRFMGLGGPFYPQDYTLYLPFSNSLGGGTWTRTTNAWNPETGAVAPHNLFLNSATGATQSITLPSEAHTLSFLGTGSVTLGGTGTGSLAGTGASDRVSLAFTPTAGSVSFTVTGSITEVVVCRGAYQGYNAATSSAVYAPRYVTGKVGTGLFLERASTNSFLNSATPVTQNISVTTANSGKWVCSVIGAGTVTSSAGTATATGYGAATAGSPNTITVTSNGTVTYTVSGADSTTKVQVENNPYATSYMPTTSATATRSAETDSYNTSGIISTSGSTIAGWWKPEGEATGTVQAIWSSYTDANNYTALKYNGVIAYIEKAKTGQTTEYVTYAITLPTTSFTHFAVLINADGSMNLYVNGVSAQSGLGSELITNVNDRTFGGATTNWTLSGATISGGTLNYNSNNPYISNYFTNYKKISVAYDIVSLTSGYLQSYFYDPKNVETTLGLARSAVGSYVDSGGMYDSTHRPFGSFGSFVGSIDNVSVKEIYNSTSTAFAPVIASTMQVGSLNGGSQGDGTLDEFYFYNRVLSVTEIQQLYNL